MERVPSLFVFGLFAMMLSASYVAWGKAHVPINNVQVCGFQGKTRTVSQNRLDEILGRGACRLPACDFNNVFQTGDDCPNMDDDEDGFCDVPPPRASANGSTPLCTPSF